MDDETAVKLIKLYECHRVLWDPLNKKYCNKNAKQDAWNDIISKLGIPVDTVKKKITNLTGSYRRKKSRHKNSRTTVSVPPIQKCTLSDSSCLKKSAQNALAAFAAGIPEIGTEVLDPVHIDVIKIDLSGFKLTMKDADITGFKNTVVDKLKIDTAKKVIEFVFHAAPLILKSKYKAGGMLLNMPISGDGDATIKIKNMELAMTMPYDIIKKENGKDVIDLKSYKYTFENNENTHFELTNLFNGNQVQSDTMHTFMNENWKPISQEFSTPLLEKPVQKIFTAIKTYLRSQPLEDIANI